MSVQTMCKADPHDAAACRAQLLACAARGCDIFRMAVPDLEAARVLGEVRAASPVPVVADVHFDWRCALAALEAGADALRINPGNIGPRARVQAVARVARARGVPIRIGANGGSLRPGESLVGSALAHLKILEDEGVRDVVVSAKASGVAETLAAYRELAERTDCPLHVGVTEAGTLLPGAVRSAVALGVLLSEGIGDTVRVSLTGRPEDEVRAGLEILRAAGLRAGGPSIVSCPTCGRTKVDLVSVAARVEEALAALAEGPGAPFAGRAFPKVAVMGCAVNGPGEARDADVALCGGDGDFVLYVRGRPAGRVSAAEAPGKVVEHVVSL